MKRKVILYRKRGLAASSVGKESACNAGHLGPIPGSGRSHGEGKGYPLQYSGLENSTDYIAHGVAESDTTERVSLSVSEGGVAVGGCSAQVRHVAWRLEGAAFWARMPTPAGTPLHPRGCPTSGKRCLEATPFLSSLPFPGPGGQAPGSQPVSGLSAQRQRPGPWEPRAELTPIQCVGGGGGAQPLRSLPTRRAPASGQWMQGGQLRAGAGLLLRESPAASAPRAESRGHSSGICRTDSERG